MEELSPKKLFYDNVKLVYDAYYNYYKPRLVINNVDPSDIIQIGLDGLWRAAQKYDSSKGYAFSTYAYTAIKNSWHREIHLRQYLKRKINENLASLEFETSKGDQLEMQLKVDPEIELDVVLEETEKEMYEYVVRGDLKMHCLFMWYSGRMTYENIKQKYGVEHSTLKIYKTMFENRSKRFIEKSGLRPYRDF